MTPVPIASIKAKAHDLGFCACGVTQARPVDAATATAYRQWIADGGPAEMGYLARNVEMRLDPTLLLPGARTIVMVALNYRPQQRIADGEYQIAGYAYGHDYHDIMKERLRQLAATIATEAAANPPEELQQKVCVDTVPLLERYWAVQAGLGFVGLNHQLIVPGIGSECFLGAIVTTAAVDAYDEPSTASCGNCRRCIAACPTGALSSATGHEDTGQQLFTFRAEQCLSYLTIECRQPLSDATAQQLGTSIYGCDRCLLACPHNSGKLPTDVEELAPSERLLHMRRTDWQQLTPEQYRDLFRGSAVKRAKYEGLMRNIEAVDKNNNESQ